MTAPLDRVLDHETLRTLRTRSDARGALRLGVHLACLIAAGCWVAAASGWMLVPAVFVLGLVQVALFAPAHETMHQTAFASRRANAVVGWLTAAPSLLNAEFYAAFHLAHHRHTQVAGLDPELMSPAPSTPGAYALRILGLPFWRLRLTVLADCWRGDLSRYPFVAEAAAPAIIRGVRAMSLVMLGGAVGSALLFGWATPFLFWIGPQVLGQPPLRAYLAGRAYRMHARSRRVDEYANHADDVAGTVADVEHAVSRGTPHVSVDPVPPVAGGARGAAGAAGLCAERICKVEHRLADWSDAATKCYDSILKSAVSAASLLSTPHVMPNVGDTVLAPMLVRCHRRIGGLNSSLLYTRKKYI